MELNVYTDWWCIKNPWGKWAYCFYIVETKEFWFWISESTTNNVMELSAIKGATDYIINTSFIVPSLQVNYHSDSQYALWVISGTMKPSVSRDLIRNIQTAMHEFEDVSFNRVKAHWDNPYNIFCDEVCTILMKWENPESYISRFLELIDNYTTS